MSSSSVAEYNAVRYWMGDTTTPNIVGSIDKAVYVASDTVIDYWWAWVQTQYADADGNAPSSEETTLRTAHAILAMLMTAPRATERASETQNYRKRANYIEKQIEIIGGVTATAITIHNASSAAHAALRPGATQVSAQITGTAGTFAASTLEIPDSAWFILRASQGNAAGFLIKTDWIKDLTATTAGNVIADPSTLAVIGDTGVGNILYAGRIGDDPDILLISASTTFSYTGMSITELW